MPEPVTLASLLLGFGPAAAGRFAGNEAQRLFREWHANATDPASGLPLNHDLNRASRASLRGALQVLLIELARRVGLESSWPNRLVEHGRGTAWLARPLFGDRPTPQQQWLDALREAVAGPAFDAFHDQLHLSDDQVRQCFREGELCQALGPALADRLIVWAREQVRQGEEPGAFETLARNGWEVSATGPGRAITLAHAYCLFFREHLKSDPRVFNVFTADTLNELRARLEQQGTTVAAEVRDAVAKLAAQPPVFSQFENWLTPQLGELKELIEGVKGELERLASGQGELKGQQGEILVVLVTLATEVRRGNAEAEKQLADLRGLLTRQHADQMAAHELTHESLGRVEETLHGIKQRVAQVHRPPFDRLPAIPAGVLIGRDPQRDDLAARLRQGEDVLVVAPGGFGKTALAAEAIRLAVGEAEADLARSPFRDGVVLLELYQIKADPERVWHTLADRFAPGAHADLPARERARRVCSNLQALVVVEGAEEAGDRLPELLSVLGTRMRRLVLTRNAAQNFTSRPIRLERELEPADARALLRRLSPERGTGAQFEEIVSLFGGHPLALTNAGCQLTNPDDSPTGFLADLRAAPLVYNVEPGNPRHPLRWSYDRSWRLLGEDARRVLVAAGCLAYVPFGLGAAEAALGLPSLFPALGAVPGEGAARARAALRQLVQHGFLTPPTDTDDRWRIAHALTFRYAADAFARAGEGGWGGGAGSDLLPALAAWVVVEFATSVNAFQRRGAQESLRDSRPIQDVLAHATALLIHETPPATALASHLDGLVDGMPRPGQTVVLCPTLVDISRQLYERFRMADDAGQTEVTAPRARWASVLGLWLKEVGRRAEALGPAQEAVELTRALALVDPDPFAADFARSLGRMGCVQHASGNLEASLSSFREAAEALTPAFQRLPEAFAPLIHQLAADYLRVLAAVGREPDRAGAEAFLVPIEEGLQRLLGSVRAVPFTWQPG